MASGIGGLTVFEQSKSLLDIDMTQCIRSDLSLKWLALAYPLTNYPSKVGISHLRDSCINASFRYARLWGNGSDSR